MSTGVKFIAAALAGLLMAVAFDALAADSRRKSGDHATQHALGEVDRTSGWCDDATTTPANIWDSANVPAEIASTAAGLENRRAIRYLMLHVVDATDAAVPVCVRLGPNTGSTPTRSALTCVATAGSEATNGAFLPSVSSGRSWVTPEIATTASPAVFVRSSAAGTGAGVRYCVEVTWKS